MNNRIGLACAFIFLWNMTCREVTLSQDSAGLIGEWNVTVTDGQQTYPSWFEVKKSGRATLVGRYVGQFGSARPIAEVRFENGEMRFEVPPQWEDRKSNIVFEGKFSGDSLVGQTSNGEDGAVQWIASRAPALSDPAEVEMGQAEAIFNGSDLAGWQPRFADRDSGWEVINGILTNNSPGNDLLTAQKYTDFNLKAQFRYPKGSNSGIYLRGRYELQIEDNLGMPAESHLIGGVYGFLTPSYNASKQAGQWQEYDITLVGRRVSVVLNGKRVIDNQLIPGITGGAIDSDEASPGPILLQGDHGPVEFRKLTLTPLQPKK